MYVIDFPASSLNSFTYYNCFIHIHGNFSVYEERKGIIYFYLSSCEVVLYIDRLAVPIRFYASPHPLHTHTHTHTHTQPYSIYSSRSTCTLPHRFYTPCWHYTHTLYTHSVYSLWNSETRLPPSLSHTLIHTQKVLSLIHRHTDTHIQTHIHTSHLLALTPSRWDTLRVRHWILIASKTSRVTRDDRLRHCQVSAALPRLTRTPLHALTQGDPNPRH